MLPSADVPPRRVRHGRLLRGVRARLPDGALRERPRRRNHLQSPSNEERHQLVYRQSGCRGPPRQRAVHSFQLNRSHFERSVKSFFYGESVKVGV